MEALEFGEYIKSARKKKKMTIRQLELYSEVSNAYISQLERGIRGIPSPDILRKLAPPLGLDYNELMIKAGYVNDPQLPNKVESEYSLPESVYDQVIKEAEEKYGVNLRDDPVVNATMRELILTLAKNMKGNQ